VTLSEDKNNWFTINNAFRVNYLKYFQGIYVLIQDVIGNNSRNEKSCLDLFFQMFSNFNYLVIKEVFYLETFF